MALQTAAKLASEIGRDFSPGTINLQPTRASAPGTCSLRVSAATSTFSSARRVNCNNRISFGTSLGPPWDFDGTSECLTLLEKGLYAKSPIEREFSNQRRHCGWPSGTPSLPQVPISPIFARNPLRIIDFQEGKIAI